MKISITTLLFYYGVVKATGIVEPTVDKEKLLALALTAIIQRFYVNQSNNIFFTSSKADTVHNSILQKMFATLDGNVSMTWILHDEEYSNGNVDRICNIALVDSYESFRLILESITKTSFDHYGYYTIVLTNYDFDQHQSSMLLTNIFRDFWNSSVANVNILTYSEATPSTVLLHTYFPFAKSHCGNVVPVIWNTFERDRFVETNKEIFPSKTSDLHQCPVAILVSPFEPYIYITRNNSDGSYNFDGIEYNVLQELSRKINFKLNFSIYWDINIGTLYENGSGVGLLRMLVEKKYDMVAGGLMVTGPGRYKTLSSTKYYSYDGILLVLPNPRPYSPFETLFLPFTLSMWIVILATLAVAFALITSLKCNSRAYYDFVVGTKNPSPYFNLLSVVLTGVAFYVPKVGFARFLLFVWLVTCLVLQTVYQGQLFSFIKMNKMVPSVKNIDELVEIGFSIKLAEENFINFLKFDKRLDKLLKFVDPNSTWEYVTETEAYIKFEAQLAVELQRNNSERIFVPKPKTITIFRNRHVLYSTKRFYLKESMDFYIIHMNENGLTSKWDAAILKYENSNVPRTLKISQLLGMVEAWFGMLILSFVLFILEVLSASRLVVID